MYKSVNKTCRNIFCVFWCSFHNVNQISDTKEYLQIGVQFKSDPCSYILYIFVVDLPAFEGRCL